MPSGQAEGSALPKSTAAIVSNSSTVTEWSPLQPPTQVVTDPHGQSLTILASSLRSFGVLTNAFFTAGMSFSSMISGER